MLTGALAGIAATIGLSLVVKNGVIRRRLRFVWWVTGVYLALHVAGTYIPAVAQFDAQREPLERLLLTLALISGAVSLLNPWFRQGVPDRLPSILQDTIVLGVFLAVATVKFHEQLALTSAVGAAVIGFALQDTLGNAFAGLAIQIDRPFRVGHWITVGAFEGLVTEITWRATKLRTKTGNLVVVPNNVVSKDAIHNFSEPEAPTRLQVEVGVSYHARPNDVKAALLSAARQSTRVLSDPAPDVMLVDFAASSITYRVRFWIADFAADERARDEVRTFIYYELQRRGMEIPYPIQVEYSRTEDTAEPPARRDALEALVAAVPVFAGLPAEAHRALALDARSLVFAHGEAIVREGDPGQSMFVVERGQVDVVLAAGGRVATTPAGGYFGEMSLLTGAARSATVVAVGDCAVVEISADGFRSYVRSHPDTLAGLAAVAATRQQELDQARAGAVVTDRASLLDRMKQFFGI